MLKFSSVFTAFAIQILLLQWQIQMMCVEIKRWLFSAKVCNFFVRLFLLPAQRIHKVFETGLMAFITIYVLHKVTSSLRSKENLFKAVS